MNRTPVIFGQCHTNLSVRKRKIKRTACRFHKFDKDNKHKDPRNIYTTKTIPNT